jgi:hypothetical protein
MLYTNIVQFVYIHFLVVTHVFILIIRFYLSIEVKKCMEVLLYRIRCNFRSGTREVHNKLEKNRRAHLKECFELLKKQVPASQDEKKTSNLSILRSAIRYIQVSRCSNNIFYICMFTICALFGIVIIILFCLYLL